MCRQRVTTFDPSPRAAGGARAAVGQACDAWGIAPTEDLLVIASELVTNAVLHARTAIDLQVCVAAGVIEVAVGDSDTGRPTVRPDRSDLLADLDRVPVQALDIDDRHPDLRVGAAGSVAAGRGLLLVASLAHRWGVVARPGGGKDVWAQVEQPTGWPHRADCRCAGVASHSPGGLGVRHIAGAWDAAS